MKSIIREIFYGNRGHSESLKLSKKYFELLEETAKLYNIIKKELSAERKIEFEKLCDLKNGLEAESAEIHFIEGVKLGIILGIEACD